MAGLTKEQLDRVTSEIDSQGISFDPLRSEFIDHMLCDIEWQMSQGLPFEHAWQSVKKNIDNKHLKLIQTETMELINKKRNSAHIVTMITLGVLSVATLFKVMHWPGAFALLFAFMMLAITSLILGIARGTRVYSESKGRNMVWLVAVVLIISITGLTLKMLHLPGSGELLYLSVGLLCTVFPTLSVYFYIKGQHGADHLLIKLLDKHSPFIERIALTLISFGIVLNYFAIWVDGQSNRTGIIFFIFAIILTGIYIYSLLWRQYVNPQNLGGTTNRALLIISSMAFIMFVLPTVGSSMNYVLRHVFAYLPLATFCLIVAFYYLKYADSDSNALLSVISLALAGYPILRFATKMSWLEGWFAGLTSDTGFVAGFLVCLLVLFFVFRKEFVFKLLVILTIASHMIPNL